MNFGKLIRLIFCRSTNRCSLNSLLSSLWMDTQVQDVAAEAVHQGAGLVLQGLCEDRQQGLPVAAVPGQERRRTDMLCGVLLLSR